MANDTRALVKQIRSLLDRMIAADRLPKDDKEEEYDRVREESIRLPRDEVVEALDAAVGKNTKRLKVSVYLLTDWTDSPEVIERIKSLLDSPDADTRSCLIQTIGKDKLTHLAPCLRRPIESDPDDFCQDMAIHAAGLLRSRSCLPAILELTKKDDPELRWRLAETLSSYATEECRPFLEKCFQNRRLGKSTRIFAARGLGKLGDASAVEYLVEMLDDPVITTPKTHDPGESLRAAQALCDVFQWPFEWNTAFVKKTKDRVAQSQSLEPDVSLHRTPLGP